MTLPNVRREGELLIGRSQGRLLRSRWRHARIRLVCALRDHDWSPWQLDDYDGPGEYIGGDPEAFMPYLSRESRDGEYGLRVCRRRCGTHEQRWPAAEAPALWRAAA